MTVISSIFVFAKRYREFWKVSNSSSPKQVSMNLAALPETCATNEPEMPFTRHQRNSQRITLVVVSSGDGELLSSAPSSVAGEMLPVRMGHKSL